MIVNITGLCYWANQKILKIKAEYINSLLSTAERIRLYLSDCAGQTARMRARSTELKFLVVRRHDQLKLQKHG
jgi:hypothetical protein